MNDDWFLLNKYIGRRVSIKWTSGKFYSGTITNYNKGLHEISYDDGEIKECNLNTLIWKFIDDLPNYVLINNF